MFDHLMDKNVGCRPVEGPAMNPACPNGQLYTVKPGDSMFFIAKRFNIALQDLINANPQITDPNLIFPGQVVCVPVAEQPMPMPAPAPTCPNGQLYQVVRGDTMFDIAGRFGISLDALIAANPQIPDPNLIFPGQELCIPLAAEPVSCANGVFYTVKPGDTLFDIAQANNIPLSALIMANPQIADPNLIFPGQVICVPMVAPPVPAPPEMPMPVPAPCPMPQPPILAPAPAPRPAPVMPMPAPCPMPAPVMPMPAPCPMPAPVMPMPAPAPMPTPMMPMPAPCPMRMPSAPSRQPMVMPAPCPLPAPVRPIETMPVMPCPAGPRMMCSGPMYIALPWQECPYRERPRKKKRHRRHEFRCH